MKTINLIKLLSVLTILLFSVSACEKESEEEPATAITIDESDHLYFQGGNNESFSVVSGSISIPLAGEGKTWDYSSLVFSNYSTDTYRNAPSASPAFTGASYVLFSSQHAIGYEILVDKYLKWEDQNLLRVGEAFEGVTFTLPNSMGSLVFPSQVVDYIPTPKIIKLPMVFGQKATETFTQTYQGSITAPTLGLDNAIVEQIITSEVSFEIIGWGTLKVNGLTLRVLLKKEVTTIKDHYKLNGEDAPEALLAAFGFTQDLESVYTDYNFFQKGQSTAVFTINIGLGTYSNAVFNRDL